MEEVMDNYKAAMYLHSESGYCMPFEDTDGIPELTLPFGETIHPTTHESFYHTGVDFSMSNFPLYAMADGVVSMVGNDERLNDFIQIRYEDYAVIYGHVSSIQVVYGQKVQAGHKVAVCSRRLHIEVRYKGQLISPIDFLRMIAENCHMYQTFGINGDLKDEEDEPSDSSFDAMSSIDVPVTELVTDYDAYQDEITALMVRYYNEYFNAIRQGTYQCLPDTRLGLSQLFSIASLKKVFFEKIPSVLNPFGTGKKAAPIAARVQSVLIRDFLNYVAVTHQIFLSGMTELEKKK